MKYNHAMLNCTDIFIHPQCLCTKISNLNCAQNRRKKDTRFAITNILILINGFSPHLLLPLYKTLQNPTENTTSFCVTHRCCY